MFTAIAVALLPLALLAYERARATGSPRLFAAAAAGGLVSSWLQPWQGVTLAFVILGTELVLLARERSAGAVATAARRAVPVLVAIALPLVYYLVLSHTDETWEL